MPRSVIPANHWNWLSWKAHRPRRSAEGRRRATRAVLRGCQVSAGEHAQRRLTSRLPLPSRDGHSSTCPTPGAALRWAHGQRRGRGVAAGGCAGGSRGRAPRHWRTRAFGLPIRPITWGRYVKCCCSVCRRGSSPRCAKRRWNRIIVHVWHPRGPQERREPVTHGSMLSGDGMMRGLGSLAWRRVSCYSMPEVPPA